MLIPRERKLIFYSFVLLFLFISGFMPESKADTIYLKNGRNIEGLIKSEDMDSIELDVGLGIVGIRKSEIERIERSSPEEADATRQEWSREKQARQAQVREERLAEKEKRPPSVEVSPLQRPKEVDVSQEAGHIFVEAVLNKKVKAQLLLDTGASIIVLSNEMGRKLGIDTTKNKKKDIVQLQMGDGRKIEARYISLDTVSVQGVEAKHIDASILLNSTAETNFKDGLLGMSFLKKFNFKIDHSNKQLILENLK